MTQAYVYNGKEVFLTGRTAMKSSRAGKDRVLFEVKPIKFLGETSTPPGIEDWVNMRDLYKINTGTEEHENG